MREIRRGRSSDLPVLTDIFWRGVHEGAAPRYTASERAAWLPVRPDPEALGTRLHGQAVFVAEEGGAPGGFMTITSAGYLDFAYVLPKARGTGLADALLAMVLNHAAARGVARLTTRASEMARPFFLRHGWSIVAPAPQTRGKTTIQATDMAFDLTR